MSATDPITRDPGRFSIRLPGPLWIAVATVVLVAVALGLRFGVQVYQQHLAIQEIQRLRGKFETRPRGPEWMRERLGPERVRLIDDVVSVDLAFTEANDATLSHVGWLKRLECLYLSDTHVTDAGMSHLNGLTKLELLGLDGTHVTGTGLSYLKRLSKLEILSLGDTQVTDAQLVHLGTLTKLRWLYLTGTAVTDRGLSHLKMLTGLQQIWFDHSQQLTDASVAELQRELPRIVVTIGLTGREIEKELLHDQPGYRKIRQP